MDAPVSFSQIMIALGACVLSAGTFVALEPAAGTRAIPPNTSSSISTSASEPPARTSEGGASAGVADHLVAIAGDHYAGLAEDQSSRRIVAFWAGQVPLKVREYVATHPDGYKVELHDDARFTRAQLLAGSRSVASDKGLKRFGIAMVSAHSDGSGLTIGLDGGELNSESQARVAAVAGLPLDSLRFAAYSGLVDLPLRYRTP